VGSKGWRRETRANIRKKANRAETWGGKEKSKIKRGGETWVRGVCTGKRLFERKGAWKKKKKKKKSRKNDGSSARATSPTRNSRGHV